MQDIKTQSWEFGDIHIGLAKIMYDKLNGLSNSSNKEELVRIHFGLKGDYSFRSSKFDRSFDLLGGHHNILYSQGLDLEVRNKSLEIETFGVNFPKNIFLDFTQDSNDLLKRFADKVLNGESVLISDKWGSINAPIQSIIDEIILNPYSGSLQNIFLLAKTLELLVLCVENYRTVLSIQYNNLKTQGDKERIIAARDFINARISNPPTISEIAREVGVNEFKLKNGFKEMFQSTVFGYLKEKRLNLAKQYLLDTEITLAEIANMLGYSSTQHFHSQFKLKFGITPNSIRKTA